MANYINGQLLITPNSAKTVTDKSGSMEGAWYKYTSNSNQALFDLDDALATANTSITTLTTTVGVNTPPGVIFEYAASAAPTGWLLCDGSAVSRLTYASLFAIIGTTWGAGDGSTTFNVPDRRGTAGIGMGTGSGLTARTLAATGGEETHLLITSEMPSHSHAPSIKTYFAELNLAGGAQALGAGAQSWINTVGTASAGGDGAHNNMQPFIVMN